ncbi:MAG: DUF547 domain-containing protein [Porticoccaceae bacterium]|nr:MAG: DUF547 domain-containing protein [Porticoccaceae bacterium]
MRWAFVRSVEALAVCLLLAAAGAAAAVEHGDWDALLGRHAHLDEELGVVRFAYGALTGDEVKAVRAYAARLARLDPDTLPAGEREAAWLNLYNALSVLAVWEEYPALREASFRRGLSAAARAKPRIEVAGRRYSLDDLQRKIGALGDERLLFGLNCTTLDCPNLAERAFTGGALREQLGQVVARFVNAGGVRLEGRRLRASRRFRELAPGFAADEGRFAKFLAHYAVDLKALYILGHRGQVEWFADGRLNVWPSSQLVQSAP